VSGLQSQSSQLLGGLLHFDPPESRTPVSEIKT
jgi:hypothetical protein